MEVTIRYVHPTLSTVYYLATGCNVKSVISKHILSDWYPDEACQVARLMSHDQFIDHIDGKSAMVQVMAPGIKTTMLIKIQRFQYRLRSQHDEICALVFVRPGRLCCMPCAIPAQW